MKKLFVAFLLFLITACSSKKDVSELLRNDFQEKIYPESESIHSINLDKENLKEILILLHFGIARQKIMEHFKLSDAEYNQRINSLFGEGLIKKTDDGNFVPTCMIVDIERAQQLIKDVKKIGKDLAEIIIDRYAKIKEEYAKIPTFKKIPFDSLSFFILSDVMLGKWQMKNIEEKFIKAEPPKRGSTRYYLSLQEYDQSNSQKIKATIPEITTKDDKRLYLLSEVIAEDLMNYLENNRPLFVKNFLNSVYKDETSFREWFVWIYQFISSEATNVLMSKGYI